MRCPVLVSRTDELTRLGEALLLPGAGHGGVWVLRGEPGVGKSRLASELAAEAERVGCAVLAGRAVRSATPVPLRPLAEALLAWLRTGTVPDDRRLVPYLPALGRLAPQLGAATDDGASSVMLIGEALLRLAPALDGAGAVLVVEDLHWADPETLGVLEYVADNVRDVPLLVVATTRPHDSPHVTELVDQLTARRAVEVVDLAPLDDAGIAVMLEACLGVEAPTEVAGLVQRYSGGFPLLVEEMLADLQSSGALVATDDGWSVGQGTSSVMVPRSFARSVEARLEAASPGAREVMEAASLLGTEFDWQVVGAALGMDDRATSAAIRELRSQRLVVAEGDGFAVRHALTREAVLATLMPPDRQRIARALAEAVAARSDADGPATEAHPVLAELFETAGDAPRAAVHWLGSARTAIARGALTSGTEALARASSLVEPDSELGRAVREAEVEAHALAGEVPLALATGEALIAELEARDGDPGRIAALRLRLVRALLAGGRWDDAATLLEQAGRCDDALVDVLGARLALGRHDGDEATRLANAALAAVGTARPEVACEAWEILGRAARGRDVVDAEEAFEEGFRLADRHGLVLWRCRLLAALGALGLVGRQPTEERLRAARRAALDAGAIATAARVELDLNIVRIRYLDLDEAMAAIDSAIAMMERLRLPDLPSAYLIRALTHGLAGRDAEMTADIGAATGVESVDAAMVEVGLPGHVRAPVALARARYDEARDQFAAAMEGARRFPGLPFSLRGMWALLETVLSAGSPAGGDGSAAREEVRSGPQANSPHNRFALRYADAVALGREGDREGAERVFADAEWAWPGREPWMELHARALVARAAARDGWGDPERWFRHCLDGFTDIGQAEAASATRIAMREAGIAVPRRAAGSDRVPAHLLRLGVTAREHEVLALVAEGASNKEVADRLFLSVRTVETHVARLLQRTGAPDRSGLVRHVGPSEG